MFPILAVVGQNSTPPAPAWDKVLEMKFNGSFTDSTGRHSPVSYGAITSSSQSVDGGYSMYTAGDGRVHSDGVDGESADFDFIDKDFRIECYVYPTSIGNNYVWAKTTGGNFGMCLRINNTYVAGKTVIFCTGSNYNTVGGGTATVELPDITGQWTKIAVERVGSTYQIYIDDVSMLSVDGVTEATDPTGGAGYKGLQIGGQVNSNLYNGYIDKFTVWTK
jgi:hypothetical protein